MLPTYGVPDVPPRRLVARAGWLLAAAVLASAALPASTANALPDQRVAYAFDEGSGATTADASGSGLTGTVTGAAWTASGRYGSALVFDGTASRVRANTDVTLGGAFTYAAWIRNPSNQGYETIVAVGNRAFYLGSGVLAYYNGADDVSFGTALPTDTWHYVSLVSDGTAVRAYLDGVQQGGAQAVASTNLTAPLQVGAGISGTSSVDYFSGTIDEVRIHDRVLSAAEIVTDMNAPVTTGGGGGGDTVAPVLSGGLPTGTLAAGTTAADLRVTSDEPATCRYGTVAGTAYAAMTATFAGTGGTAHATPLTGLADGTAYTYHVRCQDAAGNADAADFTLTFSVAAGGGGGGGGSGSWATTTALPGARSGDGAVYANGFVYLVGGMDGAGAIVPTVHYAAADADGTLGPWAATTPFPVPVRSTRPVFAGGYLYVAGGSDGNNYSSAVYSARVNANGTLGPWTATTSLPQAQLSHATVAANGYLYVVGGNTGTCVNTVRYAAIGANGSIGAWNTTSALPGPRCGIVEAATVAGGVLYLAGGYNNIDVTDTVFSARLNANGTLGAWQSGPAVGTAREYHAVEAVNGFLYVVGGQSALFDGVTAGVERAPLNADGSVGAFAAAPNLPAPRGYFAAEAANGYLYVFGGGTGVSGGAPQSTVFYAAAGPAPADSTPPVLSGGGPTGALPAGSTQASLTLSTDEAATCRYATTAGTAYAAMSATFVTTGSTSHSTVVSGLQNGGSYTYYVRCVDGAGNAGGVDYPIAFTVGGGDTTAPAVAVTAPAAGVTVSGVVALAATATDAVGVAGVQFLLDGVALGAEDTSAPYGLSWPSTAAANGAHVLTALARDAAGNQAGSAPVGVTVNNRVPDGQRAAYGFGEGSGTAIGDSSGTGTAATATSPGWTAAGRYGTGITFNGSTTRVRSNADLTLPGAFTVEAWVLNPSNQDYETVLTVGGSRDVYLAGGVLNLFTGGANLSFGPALATGTWQHVAIVSDGVTVRAYVDGGQRGGTQNLALAQVSGPLQVGAWIYGSADVDYFSGSIDEVRVYGRALSAAEIQTDLAAPVGPAVP